jgi:hypothetical protein
MGMKEQKRRLLLLYQVRVFSMKKGGLREMSLFNFCLNKMRGQNNQPREIGMTIQHRKAWLGAAFLLAVSACSTDSTRSNTSSTDSTMDGSTLNSSGSTATGDQSRAGSQAAQSTPNPATSGQSSNVATAYGSVQAIDQMQRQDISAGTMGAAAAGGSIGAPTDKVYRVTVRLDDGSTQMVVLDSMPSYKIGDRVRYNNGMVERY